MGDAEGVRVSFFDGDTFIGESNISSIVNGSSQSVSIEYTPDTEGFHLIKTVIDPYSLISESNEENNSATRSIIVGQIVGYGRIDLDASVRPSQADPPPRGP